MSRNYFLDVNFQDTENQKGNSRSLEIKQQSATFLRSFEFTLTNRALRGLEFAQKNARTPRVTLDPHKTTTKRVTLDPEPTTDGVTLGPHKTPTERNPLLQIALRGYTPPLKDGDGLSITETSSEAVWVF